MPQIIGRISQIIGPVIDVIFEELGKGSILPNIHDALKIEKTTATFSYLKYSSI